MPATLVRPTTLLSAFSTVLTSWVQKWVRMYSIGRPEAIVVTEDDFAIYAEALSHLTPQQLDAACLKATQSCTFFPKPADIVKHVEQAEGNALQVEADRAWQRALKFAVNGPFSGIRELDAKTQHAARAAGGIGWIESCPESDLQWVRKRFIEAYLRIHELGQADHLLSDGEAKKLLRELGCRARGPQALPEKAAR